MAPRVRSLRLPHGSCVSSQRRARALTLPLFLKANVRPRCPPRLQHSLLGPLTYPPPTSWGVRPTTALRRLPTMAPRTRSLCAAPGVSHARLCQPSLACCTLFRRVTRSPPRPRRTSGRPTGSRRLMRPRTRRCRPHRPVPHLRQAPLPPRPEARAHWCTSLSAPPAPLPRRRHDHSTDAPVHLGAGASGPASAGTRHPHGATLFVSSRGFWTTSRRRTRMSTHSPPHPRLRWPPFLSLPPRPKHQSAFLAAQPPSPLALLQRRHVQKTNRFRPGR